MRLLLTVVVVVAGAFGLTASAAEPAAAELTAPTPNAKDEPLAKEFSVGQAVAFLDAASVTWQRERNCVTCHTNMMYLFARPKVNAFAAAPVAADAPPASAHATVRKYVEDLVEVRWPDKGPRWDAETVVAAAALAANDAATTGKLHASTRKALDKMWTVQQEGGGFQWIKCNWPPMESDDHYGACLAAVAVSVAPENYAAGESAKAGIGKLKQYLQQNPPPTLHHAAMLLWAGGTKGEFLSPQQRQETIDKLFSLQNQDGGWAAPSLGNWERHDQSAQDTASDGYGTGFSVYVLRQAGIPALDARLQRGVAWLKANQRESGRWFARSMFRDNKHFLTHAGTAFAMMALAECEVPAR